jgi:hypothetical protein
MEEGPAYVSFHNDFGERYRVESTPLEHASRALIEEHGRAAFLEAMIKGYYFPEIIKRGVPSAELLSGSFVADVHGGAYISHVSLPGAGPQKIHIDVQTGRKTVTSLDTVRAILVFLEKDVVVFVSSEISPIRPDQGPHSTAEDEKRAIRLTRQTLEFAKQVIVH